MSKLPEETIVQAFHLMWDAYPEQVRLIHRSFRVVAGNPAYIMAGGQTEVKCNVGPAEFHKGCQAMASLKSGETKSQRSQVGDTLWESFWVPVAGEEDYYVHFTNGLNESIRKYVEQQGQAAQTP